MRPAVDVLAQLARAMSTRDTRTRLISNRDGQVVHSGQEVLRRLVSQVSTPVRGDLCMQTMLDLGVTGLLEMPPAGTLTGIARRIKEVLPNCKIVGVDPEGSILAQPESLNSIIGSYKVEGIGYDFIPAVLERKYVDMWVKSNDKNSLLMSRRLIKEEGLLCGGSSGSAAWAAIQAAKTLGEGQRCVVILADSVRNYMSKFLNDDWMIDNSFTDENFLQSIQQEKSKWHGATVADLKLPTPITVLGTDTFEKALDIMKRRGFDQLPVVNDKKRAVGLITLGNLLSHMTSKRATGASPVSQVMIHFSTNRPFEEITPATPLANLKTFFEQNSVALVNKPETREIVGVCTQIDLLSFLVKHPESVE